MSFAWLDIKTIKASPVVRPNARIVCAHELVFVCSVDWRLLCQCFFVFMHNTIRGVKYTMFHRQRGDACSSPHPFPHEPSFRPRSLSSHFRRRSRRASHEPMPTSSRRHLRQLVVSLRSHEGGVDMKYQQTSLGVAASRPLARSCSRVS